MQDWWIVWKQDRRIAFSDAPAEQSLKSQSFDASGKVFKLSMFCL